MGFRHSKGINKHEIPETAKGKALDIKEQALKEVIKDQEITEAINKVVDDIKEDELKVGKELKPKKTKKTTTKKKKKAATPKVKSKTE